MIGESLSETLFNYAKINPEKISVIDIAAKERLTYKELYDQVRELASYIQSKQVKNLVMLLPGGRYNSVAWLACLVSGVTLIPLSPLTAEAELESIKEEFQPDLILDYQTAQKIFSKLDKTSKFQDRQKNSALILFTSGSTGEPKRVRLSANMLTLTAKNIINAHELTDEDRCLTPLPFFHINAPVVSLLSSILSGGQVIIADKYSTSKFWSWVEEYKPTWLSLVPTLTSMLLTTEKPEGLDDSEIRFVRTASAPLPVSVMHGFEEKFNLAVVETYGISEAGSTIFANPVPPKKRKAGSVGLPAGIEAKLCEPESLRTVNTGEIGEVVIKGENVISSYMYDRGKDSFMGGWFRTGDLGYFDDDGYLFLTGRKKDIIIRGGENIFPREIEEAIMLDSNIREAAVVGKPDDIYGEKTVAFIVSKHGVQDETNLKNSLQSRLTKTKLPDEYFFLEEMPKTKTNKIDKVKLRGMAV